MRTVAFVVPSRAGWMLPLYEAALLIANGPATVSVSLHTPEDRPLEHFVCGQRARRRSAARGRHRLSRGRASLRSGVGRLRRLGPTRARTADGTGFRPRFLRLHPGRQPRTRLRPARHLRRRRATDYPVKQAAIACQQRRGRRVRRHAMRARHPPGAVPPGAARPCSPAPGRHCCSMAGRDRPSFPAAISARTSPGAPGHPHSSPDANDGAAGPAPDRAGRVGRRPRDRDA